MELKDLELKMKEIYNGVFKDSKITFNKGCFGNDTIFVHLYLGRNEKEVANGLWDNDIFHIILDIRDLGGNNFEISSDTRNFNIKPIENWLFCSSKRVGFRKAVGDYEKIISIFKKFVNNVYKSVEEEYNNNNLLDRDMELFKNFIKKED